MGNQKNTKKQAKKQNKQWIPAVVGILVILAAAGGVLIWYGARQRASQKEEALGEYDPLEFVTLGNYTGVKVSLAVTEEDLQDEIDTILEDNSTYEQVSGTTQTGQTVYADFEGYVDGQRMDATCGSDYVELGSGEWLEGFESSLTGVNTGESVSFIVSVPEGTYGDASVDGRDVEFHATVQYICGEEIISEYTDEFVQSISKKYKTTEEYNEHLREKLKKENDQQKAEYAWTEVLDASKAKKYPRALLEEAKQEVLQGYYDMALVYGCSREEIFPAFGYESEQAFVDSDLKPLAKDTAKEYLVAEAIAQKENVSFTEEQYQSYLEEQYSGMTEEYDSIEAYEEENKAFLERQVLLEQVKQWISDHAEFTE